MVVKDKKTIEIVSSCPKGYCSPELFLWISVKFAQVFCVVLSVIDNGGSFSESSFAIPGGQCSLEIVHVFSKGSVFL